MYKVAKYRWKQISEPLESSNIVDDPCIRADDRKTAPKNLTNTQEFCYAILPHRSAVDSVGPSVGYVLLDKTHYGYLSPEHNLWSRKDHPIKTNTVLVNPDSMTRSITAPIMTANGITPPMDIIKVITSTGKCKYIFRVQDMIAGFYLGTNAILVAPPFVPAITIKGHTATCIVPPEFDIYDMFIVLDGDIDGRQLQLALAMIQFNLDLKFYVWKQYSELHPQPDTIYSFGFDEDLETKCYVPGKNLDYQNLKATYSCEEPNYGANKATENFLEAETKYLRFTADTHKLHHLCLERGHKHPHSVLLFSNKMVIDVDDSIDLKYESNEVYGPKPDIPDTDKFCKQFMSSGLLLYPATEYKKPLYLDCDSLPTDTPILNLRRYHKCNCVNWYVVSGHTAEQASASMVDYTNNQQHITYINITALIVDMPIDKKHVTIWKYGVEPALITEEELDALNHNIIAETNFEVTQIIPQLENAEASWTQLLDPGIYLRIECTLNSIEDHIYDTYIDINTKLKMRCCYNKP